MYIAKMRNAIDDHDRKLNNCKKKKIFKSQKSEQIIKLVCF